MTRPLGVKGVTNPWPRAEPPTVKASKKPAATRR